MQPLYLFNPPFLDGDVPSRPIYGVYISRVCSREDDFNAHNKCLTAKIRDLHLSCNTLYPLSPCLSYFKVLKHELFIYRDDSMTS